MNRRSFLAGSIAAAAFAKDLAASFLPPMVSKITAFGESGAISLVRSGGVWAAKGVEVRTAEQPRQLTISLHAPATPLFRLHLRWSQRASPGFEYLGDQWERSYGDLTWTSLQPERILPWYFLASDGARTFGCGVKTGPAAFCFWQVDAEGVSLWLDVRNGGSAVELGDRQLALVTIVTEGYAGITTFQAARKFCRRLCERPRLPAGPVYGGNNWYYAYGKSSAEDILRDSERVASWSSSPRDKPFMVIDDGWSENATAGPWTAGNAQFPDMAALAAKMGGMGVRPGLWVRPLFTKEPVAPEWRLQSPNAAREYSQRQAFTLDPTVPEALEKIRSDIRTVVGWRYGLIKHDFSTYDLLGRWGFRMGAALTDDGWHFADRTKTNAEVISQFYEALRAAAGDVLVLGCNTVGHLTAGLFEMQRTGDDTSGRDWNRTRKMGVNTLAFRAPQHDAFFAIDADCVGLTRNVPWTFNRQWLQLLAQSGTPLFVSAAPDAVGAEERSALREAFAIAARPSSVAEPLDWIGNDQPESWLIDGKKVRFDWYGTEGASPFSS